MTNNNMKGVDLPIYEQLPSAKASGIAGTNIVDNNKGKIYQYIQTSATACQFWVYDTINQGYQQLATPPTQAGTVANMVYLEQSGGQYQGKTYGSIYLFVGNGTTAYFYRYDEATNTWSANLGTTNIPASFATDCYLMHPGASRNNWEGGYHTGVLRTITTTGAVAVGATTVAVSAILEQMAVGTRLRFGSYNLTIGANALRGATNITVSALPQGIAVGTELTLTNGKKVYVRTAPIAGTTTIDIFPLQEAIFTNDIILVEQYVVLTAIANVGATSLTISASLNGIASGSNALYYGQMYLVGNNGTQMYRWNIGTATWSTTSANSGNPAIATIPGTVGAGCGLKWLPAFDPNILYLLRGNATANSYYYDLVNNAWATETYYNTTETFGAGTSIASRSINGKQSTLLIQKDSTGRLYEGHPVKDTLEPQAENWTLAHSTAVVGDKSCCITTPDGLEYYYILLNSSTNFLRCLLLDV